MNDELNKALYLCEQLNGLLEEEYQELARYLQGELYDEYKLLVKGELDNLEQLKKMIIEILSSTM